MSPQVKVSYFGQQEAGALGHSVLYLTGVGEYWPTPGSSFMPAPSPCCPPEGLRRAPKCKAVTFFLHHQGASPETFHLSRTSGTGTQQYSGPPESRNCTAHRSSARPTLGPLPLESPRHTTGTPGPL